MIKPKPTQLRTKAKTKSQNPVKAFEYQETKMAIKEKSKAMPKQISEISANTSSVFIFFVSYTECPHEGQTFASSGNSFPQF